MTAGCIIKLTASECAVHYNETSLAADAIITINNLEVVDHFTDYIDCGMVLVVFYFKED